MIYQGVRMLFVVGVMPSLLRLITSNDLSGDRAVRIAQERRLRYDELTVAEVMTGLSALDAIELGSMKTATVRSLVATLKTHGRDHLLVVESSTGAAPQRVCGVISRAQIERQLGTRIDIVEVAGSFAELGQMLRWASGTTAAGSFSAAGVEGRTAGHGPSPSGHVMTGPYGA